MEPPPKRMRMTPRDELVPLPMPEDVGTGQSLLDSKWTQTRESVSDHQSVPTKTMNLFDLRRRYPEVAGMQSKRKAGLLYPRVPDVTVTANVINIAVLDGSDQTSMTQIAAPSANTVLPIARVGDLTVPGLAQITGALSSPTPGSGSTSGSPLASSTSTVTSSNSGNGTSTTEERTVTVTATSTLQVSVRNSTALLKTTFRRQSIFVTEGHTTTIDESYSTGYTGYVFGGDYSTSTAATVSNNGGTSTASMSGATPSNTGAGGGVVLTPQQQQMVGGLVGGVAGVALVLLGILYFLKWYRQRLKAQGLLPEQKSRHRQLPSGDGHGYTPQPAMDQVQGSSLVPVASLAHSLQKIRPHSTYTLASNRTDHSPAPTAESGRTFQRLSGRKIPSVLLTGGDGYGNIGPASPSDYSSLRDSGEVSYLSSHRDSNSSANPFLASHSGGLASGRSTPTRPLISPFVDPPGENQPSSPSPRASSFHTSRNLASRSQLSIQTAGLSALNPNRRSEGNVTIRPSPARTPTTSSPTSSTIHVAMYTPPLMSGDIPEMPPLNPMRLAMSSRKFSDDGLSVRPALGPRSISALSARSSYSVGGKFKEEI